MNRIPPICDANPIFLMIDLPQFFRSRALQRIEQSIKTKKMPSRVWIPFLFFRVFVPGIAVNGFTGFGTSSSFCFHTQQVHAVFCRGQALFASSNSTMIDRSSSSEQTQQQLQLQEIEEQLFQISLVEDDDDRRKRFERFITTSIGREKQPYLWIRRTSPFVQQVQEQLKCLGTAVQQEAWDKYVTSGFQAPTNKKSQLWACVDMTVQFQVVVRKLDQELKP
jgi:hypothetical protein